MTGICHGKVIDPRRTHERLQPKKKKVSVNKWLLEGILGNQGKKIYESDMPLI